MKLMNKKRKGFTIVELVIVVAVIAVLSAILIPTFIGLVNKANVTADNSLVRELNSALALDSVETGKTHKTMTDALVATDKYGFNVQRIKTKTQNNQILWDSENDVFCYLNEGTVEYIPESVNTNKRLSQGNYKLWTISSEVDQTYSTYLYNYDVKTQGTTVEAKYGLDASSVEGIEKVTYNRSSVTNPSDAHEVIIYTNGGNLEINAPVDTVNHYGEGQVLNIEAVDTTNCYREFGQFVNGQIKLGKIVVETEEAKIENLLLIAKEDKSGFEKIIFETKVEKELPVFDRTDVDISSNGTLVLNVVTPETDEYIYLTKAGVIEQVVVTTEITDVSGQTGNVETKSEKTQTVAQQVANIGTKNAQGKYVDSNNNPVELENLTSVNQIVTEAKADKTTIITGKTYFAGGAGTERSPYLITNAQELSNIRECLDGNFKFVNDIDMSAVTTWTPIGTGSDPFAGKLDGDGYAIKNWNTTSSLLGYVKGTENAKLTGEKSDVLNDDYTLVEANVSEDNYTAVVKNINFEDCEIVINADYNNGIIVEYTIDSYIGNCEICKCNIRIESGWYTGIMIGGVHKSHIKDLHLAGDNNIVCVDEPDYLGNSGLIIGAIYNVYNKDQTYLNSMEYRTIIDSCINDASVTLNKTYNAGFLGEILGCIYSYIRNDVIINCVNNGNLVVNNMATKACVSAICGAHMGGSYVNIINCSNKGNITLTGNPSVSGTSGYDQISGICSYGAGPYINCSNRGTLTGNVKYIGGICAKVSSNGADGRFKNCSNTGYLYSENEDAKIGEISADFHSVTYVNVDAEDINTLNTNPYKVRLQNAGSATGTMIVPASVGIMEVDGTFGFTTVDLSNTNGTLELRVSNANITLVGNNPNASFTVVGTGNTITVAQNTVLNDVKLSGENNVITNNGTINHLSLANTTLESVNNGTAGSVEFIGSNNLEMSFVNNGSIGQVGDNWHTVQTQSQVNLTFTNNGTIYGNGTKYALLFYGNSNVTFNAGANSKLVVENSLYTAVFYNVETMRANSVVFNVASGAAGVQNGRYYGIATYLHGDVTQVTVNFN